jgi:hypothetical protein
MHNVVYLVGKHQNFEDCESSVVELKAIMFKSLVECSFEFVFFLLVECHSCILHVY